MADNPSVVSDESGNNYGGIGSMSGGIQEAQMAYLDNLFKLSRHAAPDTTNNQYFPGANNDISAGTLGSKTLGSVPIFAAGGGLFPFDVMDEMEKAKYEAEAEYYKKLKEDLDKPLFEEKLQLADPFKQPAFANKVQNTVDAFLDGYARRFGGDYTKAYIATRNDKNFQKTIRTYKEYTDMFKNVFDQAAKVETDRKDPDKYVSPDVVKAVDKFLYDHDNLESLTPETLLNSAKQFKSIMSADKLAEAVTTGYKDSVVESFGKSKSMSTNELDVWLTTKETNEGAAEDIIKTALESPTYSWLKNNPEQKAIFERGVKNRIKKGHEVAFKEIKKANADRDLDLKSKGWMDESGNLKLNDKPAALVNTVGKNAVSYPSSVKPVPTPMGMVAYIRKDDQLRRVKLIGSFDLQPTSEYDIAEYDAGGIPTGRYVEGRVNFKNTSIYTPDIIRSVEGTPEKVGTGQSSPEVTPAVVEDAITGEQIPIFGETTILTEFDNMKSTMEATIPNLTYVHEKIPAIVRPKSASAIEDSPVIVLSNSMDISDIKRNLRYTWGKKVLWGWEIIEAANKNNDSNKDNIWGTGITY